MSSLQQLKPEAFNRAASFLHQSRPLEKARFAFHFEQGSAEEVLQELRPYQNDDGGFHGLEADFGFDISNVLSTCCALHILHEVKTSTEHPLVQRALDYLLSTYDQAREAWPIIPPHDNSQPHAPWWHCEDNFDSDWPAYLDNPRPDVLTCLYLFPCSKTDALRSLVSDLVEARLRTNKFGTGMHMLICYLRLHLVPKLADTLKSELDRVLPNWISDAVEHDPTKWNGYGLRPLDVAPTADSNWAQLLRTDIDAHLDFLIESQTSDGSWHPHWDWGGTFPDAWPRSKLKWQAVLTLNFLQSLRSYGRIAP